MTNRACQFHSLVHQQLFQSKKIVLLDSKFLICISELTFYFSVINSELGHHRKHLCWREIKCHLFQRVRFQCLSKGWMVFSKVINSFPELGKPGDQSWSCSSYSHSDTLWFLLGGIAPDRGLNVRCLLQPKMASSSKHSLFQ